MNSNRKYIVAGIQGNETIAFNYTLKDLLTDDGNELTYTLQEDIDRILDLKAGESMYIKTSRDNSEDLGVIKRIS